MHSYRCEIDSMIEKSYVCIAYYEFRINDSSVFGKPNIVNKYAFRMSAAVIVDNFTWIIPY